MTHKMNEEKQNETQESGDIEESCEEDGTCV